MKRKLLLAAKILAGIAALGLVAGLVFILVILPRMDMSGADDIPPFFEDPNLTISKTHSDGTPYTINNSTATFHLDIAKPDAHCARVFSTYADALRYCQEHGLPTLPSTQLIQGRLKAFDDALCAAAELAMRNRRQHALERLLASLIKSDAPTDAVIHVATALSLAGIQPQGLDNDTRRHIEVSQNEFLNTFEAKPCGFWDASEDLRALFQSDRYLMRGLALRDSAEACAAISRAISEDDALKAPFLNLREFGAKLANPATAIPFEALAALTPQDIRQRFPVGARFALIAYSASHEQSLIDRLTRERQLAGGENVMALIIDAVKSGRLSLDPKPDSGWYDYQWHALETLLVPERGHEAAKLKLSAAYRQRLENAFATILTKERETQIKRVPLICIGSLSSDSATPIVQVTISPDFSAEPTLTVYLRFGRGYRFLRQALGAIFQDEWPRIHLEGADTSLDASLHETALFCYGLYETLCLEIGQHPHYLPDELDALDRGQAVAAFERWRETWLTDPALTNDTRVAVPVALRPNGTVSHWGTAGIKLEAIQYAYRDLPRVKGQVEPIFAPCNAYLPTDIFFEFDSSASSSPMTRAQFRSLCDTCPDLPALEKTFGRVSFTRARSDSLNILKWVQAYWGWGMLAIAGFAFWKVRRARRWIAIAGAVLLAGWGCLFALSPCYRTSFIVRRIATINTPLALICENRFIHSAPPEPRLRALAELCVHPDPQTRYLAVHALAMITHMPGFAVDTNAWHQAGIQERIIQAANDPNPDTAVCAVIALENYCDQAVVDFLVNKLPAAKHIDILCVGIIRTLAHINDPRAEAAIRPFCTDPRFAVSYSAIGALGKMGTPEAQEYLWQLAESPSLFIRKAALRAIKGNCMYWWAPQLDKEAAAEKCEALLAEFAKRADLPFDVRMSAAATGSQSEQSVIRASVNLLDASGPLVQNGRVLTWLTHRLIDNYPLPNPETIALSNLLTQASVQHELIPAVNGQDPAAIRQTLVNIMSNAMVHADSDTRTLVDWVIQKLYPEQDATSRRRRKRNR